VTLLDERSVFIAYIYVFFHFYLAWAPTGGVGGGGEGGKGGGGGGTGGRGGGLAARHPEVFTRRAEVVVKCDGSLTGDQISKSRFTRNITQGG